MKKRICIVSPSLKMGGIERALTVLADWFVSQGYEVLFISCLAENRFFNPDRRVQLLEPDFKYPSVSMFRIFHYLRIIRYIRRAVVKYNPDRVLTFGETFNPVVIIALLRTQIPVFISDRTSPDFKSNILVKIAQRMLYPLSAGFIAQTRRTADFNVVKFNNRLNIRVINNAIRSVNLVNVPREEIILYVGRLSIEKGPDRLLEAFAGISDKKGWRLIMAGTGPMNGELKAMAVALKIDDKVEFPGKVEQVDQLYSRASIYVLPSRLEGFPNSLCEAMSAGLPVICFDSIPYNEIFTPEIDGYVVPEGDIQSMTTSIEYLMKNPDVRERIGITSVAIRKRLSQEEIGNQLLQFMYPDR